MTKVIEYIQDTKKTRNNNGFYAILTPTTPNNQMLINYLYVHIISAFIFHFEFCLFNPSIINLCSLTVVTIHNINLPQYVLVRGQPNGMHTEIHYFICSHFMWSFGEQQVPLIQLHSSHSMADVQTADEAKRVWEYALFHLI